MYKTKNILLLVFAFMLVGLLAVFFTHETAKSDDLVSQENYIQNIEPWIDSIYLDQSLDNISNIKNSFLTFKGSDNLIGAAHISLFLAFDSWEKFLLTGNDDDKQQSIKHFSSASDLLPGFNSKLKTLKDILKKQNV